MRKLIKWHQNLMFNFMEKLNLGCYEVAWISWIKGILFGIILMLLSGCGVQFQYSTLNTAGYADGIYRSTDYIIEVNDSTKVDTISNLFQLRRKLRTDFNFRWDFAQYMSNQPYSYYWRYKHPRYNGIWYPQNSFDFYFNSHQYWNDWAYNYPWFGWYHPFHVRHHRYYNWYYPYPQGWYSGWNHYGYSHYQEPLTASNNNYAFINGPRGSRISDIQDTNRINRVRPNNNNQINRIINWGRNNNIPVNTNVVPDGTRVIIPRVNNNNIRVIPDSNVRPSRPSYNNRPPVYNNSRGSNTTIRSNNNSSNSSSRGSRGNIKN